MADAPAQVATAVFPGWRRNLVFVWLGVFAGMLGANFVFPFMPFFIEELGVSGEGRIAFWTGLTGSVTGLSLTLTSPLWGSFADRYGRKLMLLRALLGAGTVISLMALSQSVWHLLGLRFAMGVFAGTTGAAAALIAATTPKERVGFALGTLQTGQFAGNMVGPLAGGVVAASVGLRQSFLVCGSLYAVAVVLTYVFVRENAEPPRPSTDGEPSAADGDGLIQNLRVVIAERQIVIMLCILYVLWMGTTFVRPVIPISIDGFGDHGETVRMWLPWGEATIRREAATGVVFGVIGAASTIAALAVSPVGGRFGYRRAVAFAAIATGLLHLPVAAAGNFTAFVLFFASVGLFQGAMVPGTNALIAAAVPEGKHGSAFGLASSMQSMALLIEPLAGGVTGGLLGIRWVYVIMGCLLLGAGAVALSFVEEPTGLHAATNDPPTR